MVFPTFTCYHVRVPAGGWVPREVAFMTSSPPKTAPDSMEIPNSRRNLILVLAALLLLVQAVPLLSTRWVADESWYTAPAHSLATNGELRITAFPRSEERRVGKECRSRWS